MNGVERFKRMGSRRVGLTVARVARQTARLLPARDAGRCPTEQPARWLSWLAWWTPRVLSASSPPAPYGRPIAFVHSRTRAFEAQTVVYACVRDFFTARHWWCEAPLKLKGVRVCVPVHYVNVVVRGAFGTVDESSLCTSTLRECGRERPITFKTVEESRRRRPAAAGSGGLCNCGEM